MRIIKSKNVIFHIVILLIIMLVYGYIIVPLGSPGNILFSYKDFIQPSMGIVIIIYCLSFKSIRKRVLGNFNGKKIFELKTIFISIGVLLLLTFSHKYIIHIDPFVSDFTKFYSENNISKNYSIITLITMITIAPLWEEIYFRELLIGQLRKSIPSWISILVSILLFGIMHGDYPLFGILLGSSFTFLYFFSNSWGVAFVVHAIWNILINIII